MSISNGREYREAPSACMARTCLAAEGDEGPHDVESRAQYQILTSYLDV